ncbi:hypothetical protein PHYSODRAFT_484705 [Phytophthora sojae]|uniref:Uncharacterized protein n=1 Tax=Phytophthora sojae (strain P6497) TaxID=1094619 RepID=G4YSN9_PHYSP|nr:hypothetical protein PHYSODRAFT_484705 [Phytophthora sojae]EGZ23532.1 hypothetical protein PHYSODRAFT_484705 [Phytophthora sojae]|eukprot:XP_009518820.1 hypothetical protein PHYSODRAFT_484705 [Phytophthora sojae]
MNRPRMQPTSSGPRISKTEARMQLLERAVHVSMPRITQAVVQRIELHTAKFVVAVIRSTANSVFGTLYHFTLNEG